MAKLRLTEELALQFVGGLLKIVRSDDVVGPTESMALQRILEATLEQPVDIAEAMFTHVTADSLAKAIHDQGAANRQAATSPPREVAERFVEAATAVADAAGGLAAREVNLINRYALALGVDGIGQG